MNRIKTILFVTLAVIGSFLLAACSPSQGDTMMEEKAMMEKDSETMMEKNSDAMMKKDSETTMEKNSDAMMEKDSDAMMTDDTMMEKDSETMMEKDSDAMMKDDAMMMEKSASYEVFTQSAYDSAVAEGKTTVLFFYANWCPVCRTEDAVYEVVIDEAPANVAVFRVNYRDSDTDSAEEALARTHGVSSQHTKVIIRDGDVVVKTPSTWNEATAREQFASLA